MGAFAGIVYPHTLGMGQRVMPMLETMAHCGCGIPTAATFHNIEVGCCDCIHFQDKKNGIIAVIDGQIWNREYLRGILKKQGYLFTANHDAELAIHAYRYWGKDFFTHLQGEYVLFVCEPEKKNMFLARDPLGKKPIYWAYQQEHLLFSTECKAILATGLVPLTPSPEGLAAYFFFGYTPQDMTAIEHVNKLLPGYFLEFRENQSLSILPFWSYSSYFVKKNHLSKEEISEHLDHLLQDAVAVRLPKEESVGCLVSGGIGSASIAHYVSQQYQGKSPVSAYTVVYEGQNEEDLRIAEEVARVLQIGHRKERLSPKMFVENLPTIVWYLDEPLADPNIVATWHLGRLASEETSRVFSGMGSDELLAGHSRYTMQTQRDPLYGRWKSSMHGLARNLLLPLLSWVDKKEAFAWTRRLRTDPWQLAYLEQNALFTPRLLADAMPLLSNLFDPRVFLNKFYHMSRLPNTLSTLLYFDVKTRLADCFMFQYERLIGAHSVSWEAPFLDKDIVEFLASIPSPERLEEQDMAKWLRNILRDIFPPTIVDRPKRTRPDFLRSWASQEPLVSLFPLLQHGILVDTGIVREKWIREQIASPQAMERAFPYLWSILIVEIWFRLFIQGKAEPAVPLVSTRELLQQK